MTADVRPGTAVVVRRDRLRAWGKWLLRLTVSAVLLGLVIARVDAGRVALLVARVDWGWWALGLAFKLLSPVVSAQRFRLLIRGLGHRVSLASVVAVNLEAMFFNLVLPGELVGGVVRWARVSRHIGDRTQAAALPLAERLIDLVTQALVTAAGAHLLFHGAAAPRWRTFTAAVALAVAVSALAVGLAGRARWSARAAEAWRWRCGPRLAAWAERLERLLRAVRAVSSDPRRGRTVLFWTLANQAANIAGSVLMARGVFPQMPVLPYVAAAIALALLIQIPLTFAGVGLRELSLPVLLGAYGVTGEVGLLVGLSAFVPSLALGAAGLVVRLVGRARLEEAASAPGEPAGSGG